MSFAPKTSSERIVFSGGIEIDIACHNLVSHVPWTESYWVSMRRLMHARRDGLQCLKDRGLRRPGMRTERWRFVLCTRLRDE